MRCRHRSLSWLRRRESALNSVPTKAEHGFIAFRDADDQRADDRATDFPRGRPRPKRTTFHPGGKKPIDATGDTMPRPPAACSVGHFARPTNMPAIRDIVWPAPCPTPPYRILINFADNRHRDNSGGQRPQTSAPTQGTDHPCNRAACGIRLADTLCDYNSRPWK